MTVPYKKPSEHGWTHLNSYVHSVVSALPTLQELKLLDAWNISSTDINTICDASMHSPWHPEDIVLTPEHPGPETNWDPILSHAALNGFDALEPENPCPQVTRFKLHGLNLIHKDISSYIRSSNPLCIRILVLLSRANHQQQIAKLTSPPISDPMASLSTTKYSRMTPEFVLANRLAEKVPSLVAIRIDNNTFWVERIDADPHSAKTFKVWHLVPAQQDPVQSLEILEHLNSYDWEFLVQEDIAHLTKEEVVMSFESSPNQLMDGCNSVNSNYMVFRKEQLL